MKQAVVIIHGIGEQVPMDTLKTFVNTVWTEDGSLREKWNPTQVWSKPDKVSGNYELRRLTTGKNRQKKRTDFFELYWADLMEDTKLGQVWAWIRVLLLRSTSRVPKPLVALWSFLWIILGLTILAYLAYIFGWLGDGKGKWAGIAGVIGTALWGLVATFLVRYAGDAARYLHVAPSNIASRKKIRDAGIDLLTRLHESKDYDRIILVGHSLGTVIGYDILTHLWPRYNDGHETKTPESPSEILNAIEALSREGGKSPDFVDRFQKAQSDYLSEIKGFGNKWLVTDFVTMGSPLTYAPMLLAKDEKQLKQKMVDREYPACPPQLEGNNDDSKFTFKDKGGYIPHHGAVFAVTRWTNLYFKAKNTVKGDIIGGPLAPVLGAGIRDVGFTTRLWNGFLSHTFYWDIPSGDDSKAEHVDELRKALRIVEDKSETGIVPVRK